MKKIGNTNNCQKGGIYPKGGICPKGGVKIHETNNTQLNMDLNLNLNLDQEQFYNSLKSQNKHTGVRITQGKNEYNADPFDNINPFSNPDGIKDFKIVTYDNSSYEKMYLNMNNYSIINCASINNIANNTITIGSSNSTNNYLGTTNISGIIKLNESAGISGQYLTSQGSSINPIWSNGLITGGNQLFTNISSDGYMSTKNLSATNASIKKLDLNSGNIYNVTNINTSNINNIAYRTPCYVSWTSTQVTSINGTIIGNANASSATNIYTATTGIFNSTYSGIYMCSVCNVFLYSGTTTCTIYLNNNGTSTRITETSTTAIAAAASSYFLFDYAKNTNVTITVIGATLAIGAICSIYKI